MKALHLLGEQGGWPMTMFLTPGPAVGASRISPKRRVRPPRVFTDVLQEVARLPSARELAKKIEQNRASLLAALLARERRAARPAR